MSGGLNTEERIVLSKAMQILDLIWAIDPEMPMGAARCFLTVASLDLPSVGDVERAAGLSHSSASRYKIYLSTGERKGRPGRDLIADQGDPEDSRKKVLKLTPRGELVITQLRNILRLFK